MGESEVHVTTSDTRVEWRVSFVMWPFGWPESRREERVTGDEADARDQLTGLLSMLAPHELRPCDEHIWEPKLERRVVRDDDWEEVAHG